MRRVNSHITREILAPTLSALAIATFLLLTTQILRVGEAAFGYGLGLGDFLAILGLLLPRFFVFALPLSILVGVLAGMGRMVGDREILALGAAGLSPARLWPAPISLGLLTTVVTLFLTSWGEPWALDSLTAKLSNVIERNLALGLEPGVVHQDIPGVVLHAKERREDGALGQVFLHLDLDAGRATLASKTARLHSTGGGGLVLRLEEGEMIRPLGGGIRRQDRIDVSEAPDSPGIDRVRFAFASVSLDVGDTVGRRSRFIGSLDALTILELHTLMRESPRSWERRRANVAFHRRLALPFSCFSLALLGLGMSLALSTAGTSRRGAGFVGGMAAMLAYYLLLRVAENMAAMGRAPAPILLWAPNLLAIGLGGYLLWKAVRT